MLDQPAEDPEQLANVFEVQAGGRFVQDVDGAPGGTLLQLARELHPLRLTTGERRRRLAKTHVSQTDIHQSAKVARDRGHGSKEIRTLFDRHIQDLGDRLALEVDLEGLPVVTGALANLAGHVHIRKKVHLDLDRAVAGARLTAATLDVEGKTAGLIAADLRLRRLGKELPDVIEDARVGGWIGPRGCAR